MTWKLYQSNVVREIGSIKKKRYKKRKASKLIVTYFHNFTVIPTNNDTFSIPLALFITAQKMQFSIKDFLGKCEQIHSHIVTKSHHMN